jgi:hypothetical protein
LLIGHIYEAPARTYTCRQSCWTITSLTNANVYFGLEILGSINGRVVSDTTGGNKDWMGVYQSVYAICTMLQRPRISTRSRVNQSAAWCSRMLLQWPALTRQRGTGTGRDRYQAHDYGMNTMLQVELDDAGVMHASLHMWNEDKKNPGCRFNSTKPVRCAVVF